MNEGEGTSGVEPIAVIGLACRVPGARNAGQFWENLVNGVQARTELPVTSEDPDFVPVGYLLDDVENFDAGLFGMTPREAALTDPQHRLFLELCHSALQDAGQDPVRCAGEVGVYGGRGMESYRWTHLHRNAEVADDPTIGIGNHADTLTALTSYRLNLTGPSVGVYTACSTSLVAVHLASEALRAGECDLALAGGVNIELPADRGYTYREGGVCSVDGWCRPFDAEATGIVPGSGGGVVLLKRLSDALADGDPVRAVVCGNAINNDGAGKVSFAALSVDGQAAVIAGALAVGDIDPRTVGYVEAHGSATPHGDEIELAALTSAYGQSGADRQWCAIGSVKPNVGHLSQGAGVVGLIKTVLCLENGVIPASLGYRTPNPAIDFPNTPFYVNETLAAWESAGTPRRAAVSSFGIGGTNAHVIVEQAPDIEQRSAARPAELIQLSARSAAALDVAVRELADHLSGSALELADVAHTLRTGRAGYEHRVAMVAADLPGAVSALRQPKRNLSGVAGAPPRVAFLFPGEGTPRFAELYAAEPVFASAIDACAEVLDDLHDLRGVFAVGYALGILWRSWGVRPATMIGHGMGELVAATLAGVFELPDALRLVQNWTRLVDTLPDGAMLAVSAEVEPPQGMSVAAVNGPGTRVLSGPTDLVTRFAEELAARKVKARRLPGTRALHSAMVDPLLAELRAAVAEAGPRVPTAQFWSGRTGAPITPGQATDPGYWAALLREPVRFGDCLAGVLADPEPVLLLECGPGRQLSGFAQMQRATPVHSLPGEASGEVATCYAAAGRLWVSGVELSGFGGAGRRVSLPGYPYERQQHWIDPDPVAVAAPSVPDTFTVPGWRRLAPLVNPSLPARLGVIVAGPVGKDLVARLETAGSTVVTEPDPTVPHWVHAGALDGETPRFAGMTTVITVGAYRVLGTETVRPVLAGGGARLVDAEVERLDDLVTELAASTSDGPVALRSGYRWSPRPEPISLPDPTGPAVRYGTAGDLGRFAPAVRALPAGDGEPDAILVGSGADPTELRHPTMILLSDAGTPAAAHFDAYALNHPGTRSITLAPNQCTVDELTAALRRVLAAHLDGCITITLAGPPQDDPPADDIEARLTTIWLNLFGGNDVRVGDDFFTLGGNSLLATQLVTQVRKAFGVRLPMRAVFDAPTVAGMAAKVAELRAKKK